MFFIVNVTSECLRGIGEMLEARKLTARVGTLLPPGDLRKGHEMLEGSRRGSRGKLVLTATDTVARSGRT